MLVTPNGRKMKFLLATLVGVSLFVQALSITCYRCGFMTAAGSCSSAGSKTVECESPSLPDAVYACQVYTVNYTSFNRVEEFKGCCFYEECDKNPCRSNNNTVCSKMASCQSDQCNYNYTTAQASQRPTLPSTTVRSKASEVFFSGLVAAFATVFGLYYCSI